MAIEDMLSDIRREGVEHTSEIVKEGIKGDYVTQGAIKDSRHDILDSTGANTDRLADLSTQYYIAQAQNANEAARDLASLKVLTDANAARFSVETALNIEKSSAAAALASEKIATAVALGQSALSKEIMYEGQKTRDLINDQKYHDLNRMLLERDGEVRHWRGHYDQSQFQSLQSQLQAFQSQLQETRQGMVNFGTMAGVGQSSTSNNVR